MRLLDRYIFRQVLFACLGAIGFFSFVLLAGNALKDLLAFLVAGQVTFLAALPILAMYLPFVITYSLPMGMLCGILLVLGRLSAESETVAMRAAGLSLARIGRPVYILAVLGVLVAGVVNLYHMPLARTRQKQELAKILRGDPKNLIVPRTFVRDFRDCIVYVHDKEGGQLRDIWVWELDSEKRVQRMIRAESGTLELDEAGNQLLITLNRVSGETRSSKDPENVSGPPVTFNFETTTRALSLDWLFGKQTFRRKLEWMTWPELIAEEKRLDVVRASTPGEEVDRQWIKVKITMQEKLATAFTVLSFALIAVPLGIKVSRRETSANLGLALVLAMSYYVLTTFVHWLDNSPALRPDLLLWVPNAIFIVVALMLHRRAERA